MECIFLPRTVRASDRPRRDQQKVAGVLVLQDGAIRLERYALTGGRFEITFEIRDTTYDKLQLAKDLLSHIIQLGPDPVRRACGVRI